MGSKDSNYKHMCNHEIFCHKTSITVTCHNTFEVIEETFMPMTVIVTESYMIYSFKYYKG